MRHHAQLTHLWNLKGKELHVSSIFQPVQDTHEKEEFQLHDNTFKFETKSKHDVRGYVYAFFGETEYTTV